MNLILSLSFKGIKRNAKNEITAIKIEAKGNNVKANFANSGTEPVQPIKITYDSDNNSISIGNLSKINKEHYSYTIHEDQNVDVKVKPHKDGNFVFVTSDGETNTRTSKSTDNIIHKNKIIIKEGGDKEHVWVHKNDDNVNVEIIEIIEGSDDASKNVFIIKKDGDQTFKIKEDNASENVFIIEKDHEGAIEKKVLKTSFISSDSTEKPLIILDGKEISMEEMEKISPDNIENITVLKGDSATKKYGEKGKNGVIQITKKK